MTNNTVFIALQNNEEARPLVEALAADNSHAIVQHYPGMVKIDAPGRLVLRRATVESLTGGRWNPQDLHICLISLSGNIFEDEDEFVLERR
ncbi:MmoB/DmpM family protein [Aerosticca soli]|uniref:Phenol hydroxylase, P2 regulatory component DmpM n=1 Tax=Aerosticca soli TaxID=2010829 RepID=A0A2Z6E458_9GAMM|nr:MmoB/DmpM family protein [Aerosticca soli]MDI3261973.1 MmoB/DmpM family protein [Fulvimonas sp.]BBD79564.1 phenol hydroxylase, P2 regulatory component DmpM [Aerosticca soli]